MIKGGKGGGSTITGLHFESRVSLSDVLTKNGYDVINNEIYINGTKHAILLGKNKLYKHLLEPENIDYKNLISKKLLPDEAVLVPKKNILFIIEIKFQNGSGSVDEKLQTCGFKKQQYQKLLSPLNTNVEYIYILNDWFTRPEYKDVLDYILEQKCHYYFNELPVDILGL